MRFQEKNALKKSLSMSGLAMVLLFGAPIKSQAITPKILKTKIKYTLAESNFNAVAEGKLTLEKARKDKLEFAGILNITEVRENSTETYALSAEATYVLKKQQWKLSFVSKLDQQYVLGFNFDPIDRLPQGKAKIIGQARLYKCLPVVYSFFCQWLSVDKGPAQAEIDHRD